MANILFGIAPGWNWQHYRYYILEMYCSYNLFQGSYYFFICWFSSSCFSSLYVSDIISAQRYDYDILLSACIDGISDDVLIGEVHCMRMVACGVGKIFAGESTLMEIFSSDCLPV